MQSEFVIVASPENVAAPLKHPFYTTKHKFLLCLKDSIWAVLVWDWIIIDYVIKFLISERWALSQC